MHHPLDPVVRLDLWRQWIRLDPLPRDLLDQLSLYRLDLWRQWNQCIQLDQYNLWDQSNLCQLRRLALDQLDQRARYHPWVRSDQLRSCQHQSHQ